MRASMRSNRDHGPRVAPRPRRRWRRRALACAALLACAAAAGLSTGVRAQAPSPPPAQTPSRAPAPAPAQTQTQTPATSQPSAVRPSQPSSPSSPRVETRAWKPPASPIETIYIIPSSHYDFGFVEPPDAIRERAARHIDRVLMLAEQQPSFRWTIESVWQVNEWLKRARAPGSVLPLDARRVQALVSRVQSGQIALSAAWGSMHTDFMGTEALNRLVYGYSALRRDYGLQSDFVMMDDVPGHPASMPSVLAASGIRHALIGVNQGLAGGTALAPGQVPFYWEGPDGARVLTWISQGVRGGYPEALTDFYLDPFTRDPYSDKTEYEMFNPGKTAAPLAIMEEGVTELLTRYAKAGYAYDSVLAMHVHDFLEPDNAAVNLTRAVALWNRAHARPRLRIATPPEFFRHMERTYGSRLPVYRGEWSGLWSEAKTHSPRISAIARDGHEAIPIVETLWSAIAATRLMAHPAGSIASLLDALFTYDEHSGAGNTGWPGLNTRDGLEEQNRQYVRDLTRLQQEATRLIETGLPLVAGPGEAPLSGAPAPAPAAAATATAVPVSAAAATARAGERSVIVYNPSSWPRTDLVQIAPPFDSVNTPAAARAALAATDDDVAVGATGRTGADRPRAGVDAAAAGTASGASAMHVSAVLLDGQEVPFERLQDGRVLFVARDVPSIGYRAFTIRLASGVGVSTLQERAATGDVAGAAAGASSGIGAVAATGGAAGIDGARYRVRVGATGDIVSLFDIASARELVNPRGLLPFNHLQRLRGSEPAALPQPDAPRIAVQQGRLLQRIIVTRPRAAFERTVITTYADLDRVDIRNEIDAARVPFAGGRDSWHDAYYFAFPFALDARALQVRFEGQRGFTRVPDDYLPGARTDAVTSQHVLALSDPAGTVLLAHRQAFHFLFAGFLDVAPAPPSASDAPKPLPAMFTGKWPLPEATVYSKAFREGNQADTHDLGVINIDSVEPGMPRRIAFDYAIASAAAPFEAVRAARFGQALNVPLIAQVLDLPPAQARWTFMTLDRDNVQILTVKPRTRETAAGLVTSVPLVPQPTRRFVVRLQEIAGAAETTVRVTTPIAIARAQRLSLTEDRVLQPELPVAPLTVTLGPYEVATIAIDLDAPAPASPAAPRHD